MGTLADALANQRPRTGGPSCQVCDLQDTLSEADKEALQEAMGNPRITGTMIVRALQDYGADISVGTLRRHRRKECSLLRNVG